MAVGFASVSPMSTVYLTRDPGDSSGRPVTPRRWHCGYSFPAQVGRQNTAPSLPAFLCPMSLLPQLPSLRSPGILKPLAPFERDEGEGVR